MKKEIGDQMSQLNENEQKVYKLVVSIKNKNKVRDLSPVYNYAYQLNVSDESIQKILSLASWWLTFLIKSDIILIKL